MALAADGPFARPAEALAWLDRFEGRLPPSAAYELRGASCARSAAAPALAPRDPEALFLAGALRGLGRVRLMV